MQYACQGRAYLLRMKAFTGGAHQTLLGLALFTPCLLQRQSTVLSVKLLMRLFLSENESSLTTYTISDYTYYYTQLVRSIQLRRTSLPPPSRGIQVQR